MFWLCPMIAEFWKYIIKTTSDIIEKVEKEAAGFEFHITRVFRTMEPKWIAFAGVTANHLDKWYRRNKFCGCCGEKMQPKGDERAMKCESCSFIDYPKICPAIIVGITNGDKLLLTKYANRAFTRYALVAGQQLLADVPTTHEILIMSANYILTLIKVKLPHLICKHRECIIRPISQLFLV